MTTDLTFVERTTLLVLMAESRPVKNSELPELGSALGKDSRVKLNDLGLIESNKRGSAFIHELTDKGWVRVAEEFGAEPLAAAARSGGKALYTLMRAMRRYFDRAGLEPNEVFLPSAPVEHTAPVVDADPETQVRNAYHRLAAEPKAWVSLTRLRAALPSLDKETVDTVLSDLFRNQKINLIPEANQRALTSEDRDAALHIGGQSRHMMKIER